MKNRGHSVDRQIIVPIEYRGLRLGEGCRLVLMVDNTMIIEIESVKAITKLNHKQLLNYFRKMDKPLGLLVNFNVKRMTDGISRIANGMVE